METFIDVEFVGGKKVGARIDDRFILTDQSVKEGGEGSAPAPFDLFTSALATCSALYAKGFCEARSLSTEGLGVRVVCRFADKDFRLEAMEFQLTLPDGFPAKYHKAIARAMEQCSVKKHIMDPPEMSVRVMDQD